VLAKDTAVDSGVERDFAEQLNARADILCYIKLPKWFLVPTPLGNYNPDWAIVQGVVDEPQLYLVAETKGSTRQQDLRETEQLKIIFGRAHFKAIEVPYLVTNTADDIPGELVAESVSTDRSR
jgi:type III restriction enzyme